MGDTDLVFAPIADVGARWREATLSPVALTERCLARIETLNPRLNAFITVTAELAREQARHAERVLKAGTWLGPLHGVPVPIKDFYDTAGVRTTAGFEHFHAICGVSCFKPTFGVLSAVGILAGEREPDPAIPFLSHPCVMARSADDVALAFEAVSNVSAETTQPVRRIAVVTNAAADQEVRTAFAEAIKALSRLDVVLSETEVPFEAASFDGKSIEKDRARIDATLFADVEAIVLPTLAAPAPTVDAAREQRDFEQAT